MKNQTTPPETYRISGKKPHIISLMLLSAFASMGAILMAPGLPDIASFFSIKTGATQLLVTSFLLGYALGQLLYSPIANRFGRKLPLYIGVIIATLGSLFSILSAPIESFTLLIIGRFFEALGASAGLVVCFAVINDFYFEAQARHVTAVLMFAFAIVPGIAIGIGGLLTQYIGWQSCFYFLLLYGLLLIYPIYRLPETIHVYDKHACKISSVGRNYWRAFHNKRLLGFSLCSGFSSACIYVFGANGPFIGIHLLHIPPALYGFFGLLPYLGTLLGCFVVVRLTKLNPLLVMRTAFVCELAGTCLMFICFLMGWLNLYTLLIPMALFCFGHPMLSGTALSQAMCQTEDKANGSAIMNFVSVAMPVLLTLLLSMLHIDKAWFMPALFLLALALMVCGYRFMVLPAPTPTPETCE